MVAGAINIGLIATGGGAAKALIKNGVKGALSYSGGAAIISLGSTATLEVSAAGSLLKAGYGGSSMLNSIKNMGNDLIKLSEYISPNSQVSGEIKNVYDSIKKAPQYPEGFKGVQNGTKKVTVKNGSVLDELRKIEPGDWKKVYQNGYVNGQEASIHYFQHSKTGKVFDVKVKWKWITGWN